MAGGSATEDTHEPAVIAGLHTPRRARLAAVPARTDFRQRAGRVVPRATPALWTVQRAVAGCARKASEAQTKHRVAHSTATQSRALARMHERSEVLRDAAAAGRARTRMLVTVQLSNPTKPTPLRMATTPPSPPAYARMQRSDGWTTARTASECANVAERSAPPSCRPPHRRRTRPRRCRPRWPRRPNPVCARTVAQQRRSPPHEGAKLHGEPSHGEASGAAHVDETHIAELDAHIIPGYFQREHHAEVEHRCAGRRLTRAAQHKAQPRREGI